MIKKLKNWKCQTPAQIENRVILKGVHKIGLENIYIPEAAKELLAKSLSFVPLCKNKKNHNIMENWKAFERNVKLREHFGADSSKPEPKARIFKL